MINVAVIGSRGRMGQTVTDAVEAAPDMSLVAAIDIDDSLQEIVRPAVDVVVDFTNPDAVMTTLRHCIGAGVHCVVGTSGFDEAKLAQVRSWCAEQPSVGVLIAPNFGIAAVLMMRFAAIAAPYFESVEIVELHHPDKLDAPSGTAAHTARLVAAARQGLPAQPDATETGLEGARGSVVDGVHVHSIRARGFVAHQEVIMGERGETLTIRHDSLDRSSFMPGVLRAVREVANHPGLTVGLDAYLGLD